MDLKLLKELEKDLSPMGLRVLGDLYEDDGNSTASKNYHTVARYMEQIESVDTYSIVKMDVAFGMNVTLKRCIKSVVLTIGKPAQHQNMNQLLISVWNELKKNGHPFTDEVSSIVKGDRDQAGRVFLKHYGGISFTTATIRVPLVEIDRSKGLYVRNLFKKRNPLKRREIFRRLVLSLKISGII